MATPKKATGRPRAAIPVDQSFKTRVTKGERIAVDEMIHRWASERAKSAGGLVSPSDGPTIWFRSLVHQMCAEQGIVITEPTPDGSSTKAKR